MCRNAENFCVKDYRKADIHDVRVNNMVSEKVKCAVMVACDPANLTLENVVQNNLEGETFFGVEN